MAFPLLALIPVVEKIFDKIFPDPTAAADAKLKFLELQQTGELAVLAAETDLAKGQMAINLEEAKSASLFVSGARPFIMWTCGVAFAYHFVIQPFLAFAMSNYMGKPAILPAIDMEVIGYTLTGMLGIGGSFRTFEKVKGVAK